MKVAFRVISTQEKLNPAHRGARFQRFMQGNLLQARFHPETPLPSRERGGVRGSRNEKPLYPHRYHPHPDPPPSEGEGDSWVSGWALGSLLPPNFLDLLNAGHDLPRRDGYDITRDQEGIFRRLLGYAHEHRQHRLMIVRPHLHLAHGAVNL